MVKKVASEVLKWAYLSLSILLTECRKQRIPSYLGQKVKIKYDSFFIDINRIFYSNCYLNVDTNYCNQAIKLQFNIKRKYKINRIAFDKLRELMGSLEVGNHEPSLLEIAGRCND